MPWFSLRNKLRKHAACKDEGSQVNGEKEREEEEHGPFQKGMIFSESQRREVGLWGHSQQRGERERMRGGRRERMRD
jgi:hypothetical protein